MATRIDIGKQWEKRSEWNVIANSHSTNHCYERTRIQWFECKADSGEEPHGACISRPIIIEMNPSCEPKPGKRSVNRNRQRNLPAISKTMNEVLTLNWHQAPFRNHLQDLPQSHSYHPCLRDSCRPLLQTNPRFRNLLRCLPQARHREAQQQVGQAE